jgi:beta-lactamase regulating signal transducer with metallopeptidase domain
MEATMHLEFGFLSIAFTQLWQVTLLAMIAILFAKTVARNRPHLAVAIWFVVLAKCVTPPIWSSPTGLFCWLQPTELSQPAEQGKSESDTVASSSQARLLPFRETNSSVTTSNSVQTLSGFESNAFDAMDQHDELNAVGEFAMVSTPTETQNHLATTTRRAISIHSVIMTIWIAGGVVFFFVSAIRTWLCLRVIHRTSQLADAEVLAATDRLARKLKLRRRVRVFITESRIGPAVIGLFRPMIVIPRAIVEAGTISDLEPILAHELTHIRRNDLWFGFFQLVAGAAWWFHPLLRIVNRMAMRDAERCCDEEVIGRFGYSTTHYARSLVNVLQCKQALIPAAAFPGVRPIDITTRRLERIMKLQNGCCKRTPLWCWFIVLTVSMVVLPGAAMAVATTQEKSDGDSKSESAQNALAPRAIEDAAQKDQTSIVDYEVGKLVRQLMEENELDLETGQVAFILHLKAISGWPVETAREELVDHDKIAAVPEGKPLPPNVEMAEARGETLKAQQDSLARYFTWKNEGETLAITQTAAVHARIKRAIHVIERCGFGQTMIEIRFATCTAEVLAQIGRKLNRAHAESDKAANELDSKFSLDSSNLLLPEEDEREFSVRAVVEKEVPVISGSLDDELAREVINIISSDKRSNIMFAPKVSAFDGQQVTISNCVQRPFVVSMKDGEPVIRIHAEGTLIHLQMLPNEKEGVDLDFKVQVNDIKDVETFTYTDKELEKDFTVQIPIVERASITGLAEVELGSMYLVGGLLPPNSDRKDERLIVMFRPVKYDLDDESAVNKAKELIQAQPVAIEKEMHSIREFTVDMETLAKEPIITRSYQIADLLEGLQPFIDATSSKNVPLQFKEETIQEMIADIASEFPAECWRENGGNGMISFDPESKTLVVSNGASVHVEIGKLIREGYEFMSDRATFSVTAIRANKAGWNEIKSYVSDSDVQTLSGVETFFWKQALANDKRFTVTQLPKINLLNGQMYRFSSEALLGKEGFKFFEHAVLTAGSASNNKLEVGLAWGSAKHMDAALSKLLAETASGETSEVESEVEERDAELETGHSMLLTGIGRNDREDAGAFMLLITAETPFKAHEDAEAIDSAVLPAAYQLDDDVQYFPATETNPPGTPLRNVIESSPDTPVTNK